MSHSYVHGVRFAGVASAVPSTVVENGADATRFGEIDIQRIIKSTGIERRAVAPEGICTSDMCLAAANRLLSDLAWDRQSVDTLIVVTQTPDYILPATSCSLQHRLGLNSGCATLDVNLGCSGYTHGLWLAAHLVASGGAKRVLLLAGETATRRVHPDDRSARPLFGDAGTATALEFAQGAPPVYFRLGTDGRGQNHLIVPAGSFRRPHSTETGFATADTNGNIRSLNHLFMDGAEVFAFTIAEVPGLIATTLDDAGWTLDTVDSFVLHQANKFMLLHLAKSVGIPLDKLPLSLDQFGNTSSASIPLTITERLRETLQRGPANLLLAGFGVGFSWSSVALTVNNACISDLVVMDVSAALSELSGPQSHLPSQLR